MKSHEQLLHSVAPSQLPSTNFHIKAVPAEICSFITSILEQLPVKEPRLIPQKPSEIALGNVGILSSLALGSKNIPTSKGCQNLPKISSRQLSPKQSKKPLSHQEITNFWWKSQLSPPSHMWHMPSGQTIGQTQDWTETVKLASFCKRNSEVTKTPMQK